MMNEQEMQMQIEIAKARARAKQSQAGALEQDVQQNAPTPAPELPDAPRIFPQNSFTDSLPENPYTLGKGLVKGAVNAGIGAVKTANAVGTVIGNKLGEEYDTYAPSIGLSPRDPTGVAANNAQVDRTQKALGGLMLKPENKSEEIGMPVGEVGTGAAVGGLAGKAVGKILPWGMKTLGGLAGASTVTAAATPDQKPLIVGEQPGGLGLDINPEDDEATKASKHLVNLSLDNMATTAAFGGAAWVAGKGKEILGSIAKGIKDWRNINSIEKGYVSDMIDIGAKIPEDATREQRVSALKEMEDRFNTYSSQSYDLGEGIGEKTIQRDPVSVITRDLDPSVPSDRARQVNLESLRASAKSGNAPKTATILEQPKRTLDESLQDVQRTRGGDAAIEQTNKAMQDKAHMEATAADISPELAKSDLIAAQNDMTGALKDDSSFAPYMKKDEGSGVSLDVNKASLDKQTEILKDAQKARGIDKGTRDDAYKAIPDATPANKDEWDAAVKEAEGFIPDRVQKVIDSSDGSFKYLNNEVRPRLSEEITAAYQKNDILTADKLKKLRSNITNDQMAYLTENGNEVSIAAAKNANKENIAYSEKYNQGIGKELKVNEAINRPKTQPIDFNEKGRPIILRAIKDPNRMESMDQLRKIVGEGGDAKIADVALAESMKDITSGKNVNIQEITSNLQQMANAFTGKQKTRIEGYLTDIRDRGLNIEDLKKRIPELEAASDAAKEQIYMGKFDGLFKKKFGKYEGVDNGYRAFQKMLDNHDGTAIDSIVSEAKKTPEDLAGLQAAWSKAAEEKLSQNSKEIVPFSQEFEKYGRDIFGDNPAVDAILAIKKEAQRIQQAQTRSGIQSFGSSDNQTAFTRGISLLSTWAFGVLNPKAARIKTITSNIASRYNSDEISHKAIDNVLSSSDVVKKHLRNMIEDAKTRFSPDETKMIRNFGVQLGLYDIRHQTDDNLNK